MRWDGAHTLLVFVAAFVTTGCGPTVDLAKALQVTIVSSGWFDAGVQDGKNKLVPSLSLTLKNTSEQKLVVLQVNALFRRVDDEMERGSGFLSATGSEGLPAGGSTGVLT